MHLLLRALDAALTPVVSPHVRVCSLAPLRCTRLRPRLESSSTRVRRKVASSSDTSSPCRQKRVSLVS